MCCCCLFLLLNLLHLLLWLLLRLRLLISVLLWLLLRCCGGATAAGCRHCHRCQKQFSALHLASSMGDFAVTKAVLSAGADANLLTSQGNSALHLAAMHGYEDIVRSGHASPVDARSVLHC